MEKSNNSRSIYQGLAWTCHWSIQGCPIHQTQRSSPASHMLSACQTNQKENTHLPHVQLKTSAMQLRKYYIMQLWIKDMSSLPRAWRRLLSVDNRLIPDGHFRVKDVNGVTAAVCFWVWARKHSSKHKELSSEHTAAVVGQRRHFSLCLKESMKFKSVF